ncbi:hypothetical protein NHX12_033953 [Muraenolepis orangiensis]|uniref:Uncharacterized protein n=1 Tax=Muraenolepis orangiensis TaxID=630683 RepID=A0A9Q0E646_9TELE|nr:hypothetical protein NHX12_033953 [Muraenolepis orangiensis]
MFINTSSTLIQLSHQHMMDDGTQRPQSHDICRRQVNLQDITLYRRTGYRTEDWPAAVERVDGAEDLEDLDDTSPWALLCR